MPSLESDILSQSEFREGGILDFCTQIYIYLFIYLSEIPPPFKSLLGSMFVSWNTPHKTGSTNCKGAFHKKFPLEF